ncbi:MAG: Spy/CpxP family protein refolding chaperone [Elusimicrobia bacterium]|nr:Spy/CpxP family protein refolding chaperone [Elusimicrobiota bacterium]
MPKRLLLAALCSTGLIISPAAWSEDASKSGSTTPKTEVKKESRTERMLEMMKEKLKLDAAQTGKIEKIVADDEKSSEPMRSEMKKLAVQLNELRHKMKKNKEQANEKIREVLTPEQRLEFDKMQHPRGRRPNMKGGQGGPMGGKMGGSGGPGGQGGPMGGPSGGNAPMSQGGDDGGEGEEMPDQPMEEGEAQ